MTLSSQHEYESTETPASGWGRIGCGCVYYHYYIEWAPQSIDHSCAFVCFRSVQTQCEAVCCLRLHVEVWLASVRAGRRRKCAGRGLHVVVTSRTVSLLLGIGPTSA